MSNEQMRAVQENPAPPKGRMRVWRDRNRAAGLKGVMVWIPPEREAELRTLVERWRREADKVPASDLPGDDQLRALVRTSKTARRPVPADALASRTAAAHLTGAAPVRGADV